MNVNCVHNTNFKGKFIILNDISSKPALRIKKVEKNLREMIKPKNYDLYLEQDYRENKIRIIASSIYPNKICDVITHEELPVTAKSQRYIYAVKNVIEKHENSLDEIEQNEWELNKRKHRFDTIKVVAGSIAFLPILAVNDILRSINPKCAKKFEKNVIDRII